MGNGLGNDGAPWVRRLAFTDFGPVGALGKKDLDEAGVNAIRAAAPFGPLPDKFSQPSIETRIYFYYNTPVEHR